MRRYSRKIIAITLGFFILGIGWGVWTNQKRRFDMANAKPLRVLCNEDWLSDEVLDKFSREHNVPIQHWTYSKQGEFLRQMANADGQVDVVCTSSLLVRSLVRSHWLLKTDFQTLPNFPDVAVDFTHLPYDPDFEFTVPLFWNLYGFFGKTDQQKTSTMKEVWQTRRVSLWGEELIVLQMLDRLGVNIQRRLEEENSKGLEEEVREFAHGAVQILRPHINPVSGELLTAKAEFTQLPLSRVARLLGDKSPYHFWLPEDGGVIEVGVLAIGAKSTQVDLARQLINELISTPHALQVHQRLETGVVHKTLAGLGSIATLQKAEALRHFPLNRFTFPDVSLESLPPFQKIFDANVSLVETKPEN